MAACAGARWSLQPPSPAVIGALAACPAAPGEPVLGGRLRPPHPPAGARRAPAPMLVLQKAGGALARRLGF